MVPTLARIVGKPTLGFGHLEKAERPDLMVETLVLNEAAPSRWATGARQRTRFQRRYV